MGYYLEITVCLEEGNATCTDAGNRTCLLNTTTSDFECGNCAFGFVEHEEECLFIDDIDFVRVIELIETYAPELLTSGVSNEVRAERLKLLARVVSFFDSRVPPVGFDLGLNKYSFDLEEERDRLLGTTVNPNASSQLPRFDLGRRLQLVDPEFSPDNLPDEVDWVAEGAMTEVKDQGRCGCWCVILVECIVGMEKSS